MARSYDRRKGVGTLMLTRGDHRQLVGRVTPGDHVEVSREIERIWDQLALTHRKAQQCCDITISGNGGPVQYQFAINDVLITLGASAYWPLGDNGWTSTAGATLLNAAMDRSSAGGANLTQLNQTGGYGNAFVAPTDLPHTELAGAYDESGISFNSDQASGFGPFSYSGAYLRMPSGYQSRVEFSSNKLTMMGWFKPYTSTHNFDAFQNIYMSQAMGTFDTYDGGATYTGLGLFFNHYSGNPTVILSFGNSVSLSWDYLTMAYPVALDIWQHYCYVYDNLNLKLYINSVLKGQTTLASAPDNGGLNFRIGNGVFDYGVSSRDAFYYGGADEVVAFSGVALTQSQIATVMLATQINRTTGLYSGELQGFSAIADGSLPITKLVDGSATGNSIEWNGTDWVEVSTARVAVRVNSTGTVFKQRRINFIPGSTKLSISAADDVPNEEVDLTLNVVPANIPISGLLFSGSINQYLDGTGAYVYIGGRLNGLLYGTPAVGTTRYIAVPRGGNDADMTYDLERVHFRTETASSSGSIVARLQKSVSGGAPAWTDIGTITCVVSTYEADTTVGAYTVTSDDLLRLYFDSIGTGVTDYQAIITGTKT